MTTLQIEERICKYCDTAKPPYEFKEPKSGTVCYECHLKRRRESMQKYNERNPGRLKELHKRNLAPLVVDTKPRICVECSESKLPEEFHGKIRGGKCMSCYLQARAKYQRDRRKRLR